MEKKTPKAYCIRCGRPVFGNIDPECEITCALCVMSMTDSIDRTHNPGNYTTEIIGALKQKKLKEFRKKHSFTQEEMYQFFGVTKQWYIKLENGVSNSNSYKKLIENLKEKKNRLPTHATLHDRKKGKRSAKKDSRISAN